MSRQAKPLANPHNSAPCAELNLGLENQVHDLRGAHHDLEELEITNEALHPPLPSTKLHLYSQPRRKMQFISQSLTPRDLEIDVLLPPVPLSADDLRHLIAIAEAGDVVEGPWSDKLQNALKRLATDPNHENRITAESELVRWVQDWNASL